MPDPAGRCATCAFRPGTEASRAKWTLLTATLCVLSGEPFFCHEDLGADGEPTRLCAGAEAARTVKGDQPEWRRLLCEAMLQLQEDAEDRPQDFDTDEKCIVVLRAMNEQVGRVLAEEETRV